MSGRQRPSVISKSVGLSVHPTGRGGISGSHAIVHLLSECVAFNESCIDLKEHTLYTK